MGFSQISVESLIREQPLSTVETINRTRTLLLEAFVQNDREKVQEIRQFLSENFDENSFVTLFPFEQVLLLAWLNDFEEMLQHIKIYDTSMAQIQRKIMPDFANNFYGVIVGRVEQEFETILDNLQASHLTQEQKDFSAIYLRYFFIPFTDPPRHFFGVSEEVDAILREVNTDTREFIATFPHSEYISLFHSFELEPFDWGFGFGIGGGYSAKTGDFSNFFTNRGAAEMFIDITYKRFIATVGFSGVFGRSREDIHLSNGLIFPKDTSVDISTPYLTFGYRFFENKRIIVMPMVGVGAGFIRPGTPASRNDNPALRELNHTFLTTSIGIATDIRLGSMRRMPGQNFPQPSFFAIRLKYKFSYSTWGQPPIHFNGNVHTITASFYMFGRGTRQVRYI